MKCGNWSNLLLHLVSWVAKTRCTKPIIYEWSIYISIDLLWKMAIISAKNPLGTHTKSGVTSGSNTGSWTSWSSSQEPQNSMVRSSSLLWPLFLAPFPLPLKLVAKACFKPSDSLLLPNQFFHFSCCKSLLQSSSNFRSILVEVMFRVSIKCAHRNVVNFLVWLPPYLPLPYFDPPIFRSCSSHRSLLETQGKTSKIPKRGHIIL